jgi:hypothetical protein
MKIRFAILLIPIWLFGKEPIVTTDMLKIRNVTDVKVAPDGSFAVYSVLSVHTEPAAMARAIRRTVIVRICFMSI